MPRKPKLDRVPFNIKPERQTDNEFTELQNSVQPRPTKEAMFKHIVHQAWLQLKKSQALGDEPTQ